MKTFVHTGDLGDIIYSLPIIRQMGGGNLILHNRPDVTRPMDEEKFKALELLLQMQPYLHQVFHEPDPHMTWEPEVVDFTHFRGRHAPKQTLCDSMWQHVHRKTNPPPIDTATPWLDVGNVPAHGKVVIARSARYHNRQWDRIWPALVRLRECVFVGTKAEHEAMEALCHMEIAYAPTENLHELACLIKGASLFVGNQSCPFALAEAMKVPRVLEVDPKTDDCRYRGGDVHYIDSLQGWLEFKLRDNIVLVLQVCPHDVEAAKDLARLMAEIEPTHRYDVDFILFIRRDVKEEHARDILETIAPVFPRFRLLRGSRRDTGWPEGCNAMWEEMIDEVDHLMARRLVSGKVVLTFEPDCIPLRPDWINALRDEFVRLGVDFVGHAHNDPKTHINGNLMLAPFATMKHKLPIPAFGEPWDVAAGPVTLRHGSDTNLIYQLYRLKEVPLEKIESLRKGGVVPALFHGIKDSSGRGAVRAMMRRGTFGLTHETKTETQEPEKENQQPEAPDQGAANAGGDQPSGAGSDAETERVEEIAGQDSQGPEAIQG